MSAMSPSSGNINQDLEFAFPSTWMEEKNNQFVGELEK